MITSTSPRWTISKEDLQKFARNGLIFLAPLALLYLGFVTAEIKVDGFQPTDVIPTVPVIGAMILYILNVATDFFNKFVKDNTK
jgi:hypothetical protein